MNIENRVRVNRFIEDSRRRLTSPTSPIAHPFPAMSRIAAFVVGSSFVAASSFTLQPRCCISFAPRSWTPAMTAGPDDGDELPLLKCALTAVAATHAQCGPETNLRPDPTRGPAGCPGSRHPSARRLTSTASD